MELLFHVAWSNSQHYLLSLTLLHFPAPYANDSREVSSAEEINGVLFISYFARENVSSGGLSCSRLKEEQKMTITGTALHLLLVYLPPLYHLMTERKQWLVLLTADMLCPSHWYCLWLTLVVTSVSNSAFYLHHSSVITHVLLWFCVLVLFSWLNCQPVIITARYRMSFCPTLCTAHMHVHTHTHTHTHTQRETEMRHRCQLGEMAAITLIAVSETHSLSAASVSLSSLWGSNLFVVFLFYF